MLKEKEIIYVTPMDEYVCLSVLAENERKVEG